MQSEGCSILEKLWGDEMAVGEAAVEVTLVSGEVKDAKWQDLNYHKHSEIMTVMAAIEITSVQPECLDVAK